MTLSGEGGPGRPPLLSRARLRRRWVFLLLALASVFTLAQLSWKVLELDRRATNLRVTSHIQNLVREAQRRLDADVALLLAHESGRPAVLYQAVYETLPPGGEGPPSHVESELLRGAGPLFRLHFQRDAEGRFSSPQAPAGRSRVAAVELLGADPAVLDKAAARLRELVAGLSDEEWEQWSARLTRSQSGLPPGPALNAARLDAMRREWAPDKTLDSQRRTSAGDDVGAAAPSSGTVGSEELVTPSEALPDASDASLLRLYTTEVALRFGLGESGASAFHPRLLIHPETGRPKLVFARSARLSGEPVLQGFWLDWSLFRAALTLPLRDLLPNAQLVLANEAPPGAIPLAQLPVALVPGPVGGLAPPSWSPSELGLALAWATVLAAGAVGLRGLRAAETYAERRGRFASTVTHELRTPLTTFCLYSEMLADGVVTDPKTRDEYLETLRRESQRLRRIVENVLLFARVEEGRAAPALRELDAADLVLGAVPQLDQRCREADLELEVELDLAEEARVVVDEEAVGRVLFNLVDNAAKYAGDALDRRVHLEARVSGSGSGRRLELSVRDHGPGIAAHAHRGIFAPFERAGRERDGAQGAPGMGLGLSLARGIARQLGGELVLEEPADGTGARFRLSLPLVAAPARRSV